VNIQYFDTFVCSLNEKDNQCSNVIVLDDNPYIVDNRFPLVIKNADVEFLRRDEVDEFFGKYCKDCGVNATDVKRYSNSSFKFQNRKKMHFMEFVDTSKAEEVLVGPENKTYLTPKGIERYLKGIKITGGGLSGIEMRGNELVKFLFESDLVKLKTHKLSAEEKKQNQELLKKSKYVLENLKEKWSVQQGNEVLHAPAVRGFFRKKLGPEYESSITVLNDYGLIDLFREKDLEKIRVY
jgi:hypothetical protein